MAKGTLSRRTPNGWEIIRHIETVETPSPHVKTTLHIPVLLGHKKQFNFVMAAAALFIVAAIVLVFYYSFRSESINPVRFIASVDSPVIGEAADGSKAIFFTVSGRAYSVSDVGVKNETELNFSLLDDEKLIWINRTSDLFITYQQNKLVIYKLNAGEQVEKLGELKDFYPPADDSGILVKGQELLSADLTRHERINTDVSLLSGSCHLDLCVLNSENRIFLKRANNQNWSALSVNTGDVQSSGRHSVITSSSSVVTASGNSLDSFEIQNSQWVRNKYWNKETTPVLANAQIIWLGQKSPVSEPSLLVKDLDSGRVKYVDLNDGSGENLDGVKTSLSKFIWLKNNTLNFFDEDGNLYQHQISNKEDTK